MMYLATRMRNLWFLISRAQFYLLFRKIVTRFYSNRHSYGLRRDLRVPISLPQLPFDLTIRPLSDEEVSPMLEQFRPGGDPDFDREVIDRLEHIHAEIPTCYGAFNDKGDLVFIQWLMGPEQNDKIQSYFNSIYPVLGEGEALLENALTLNGYRGHGIMGAAVARIAELGKRRGFHTVITFVAADNEPSLRGCKRAGFLPYLLRHERWALFQRKLEFIKLSEHSRWPAEFLD